MSEPQNGRNGGVLTHVVRTSGKLLGDLPPGFLLLVLLNTAFLGLVLWFLTYELDQRLQILLRVIEACFLQKGAPPAH